MNQIRNDKDCCCEGKTLGGRLDLEAYWVPKLAYAVATGEHLAFICVNLTKPINIPELDFRFLIFTRRARSGRSRQP